MAKTSTSTHLMPPDKFAEMTNVDWGDMMAVDEKKTPPRTPPRTLTPSGRQAPPDPRVKRREAIQKARKARKALRNFTAPPPTTRPLQTVPEEEEKEESDLKE
jgi:hypothetical protein